jgi:hypothetical protein
MQLVGTRNFRSILANPVMVHRDIIAVFDDGGYAVEDYLPLQRIVVDLQREHPDGIGCLVVIPEPSKIPPEEVRSEINRVQSAIRVRCLCWLVEAKGFRGALVRSVLSGLRIAQRRPYPTHVASNLHEALRWIFPHLREGAARMDHEIEPAELAFLQHRRVLAGAPEAGQQPSP